MSGPMLSMNYRFNIDRVMRLTEIRANMYSSGKLANSTMLAMNLWLLSKADTSPGRSLNSFEWKN